MLEKTNSSDMLRMNRANLTRQYAKLGNLVDSEKYFHQLISDFPDNKTPGNTQAIAVATWSKAVFYAAKKQWKEANDCFESSLMQFKTTIERVPLEAWTRKDYAQALEQQGKLAEAKTHLEEARKLELHYEELRKNFEHASTQIFLMASKEPEVGTDFDVRLDIVNVAKEPTTIVRIKNLIPSELKITAFPR